MTRRARAILFVLPAQHFDAKHCARGAALIRQFIRRRRRVQRVANPGLVVYVRHGCNTWLFDPGRFVDPQGWQPTAPLPEFSSTAIE